jgi:hypothetical protein
MYSNYIKIKESREIVNNNIGRYRLFGNSFREVITQNRRNRAI